MLGVIRALAVLVCLYIVATTANAQPPVSSRNSFERVLAVVPLIGSGTHDDPIRPMFAPAPSAIDTVGRTGVIAYTYVLSDDGTLALTEFVLHDRTQVKALLNATSSANVTTFLKGVNNRADIETAFRKFKKGFNSDKFGVWVQ